MNVTAARSRVAIATGLLLAGIGAILLGPTDRATSASGCFGRAATITSNNSFVPGTPGDDVIVTRGAANSVVADLGHDRVCTNDGADFVRGDRGNDRIMLGSGKDKASGGDLDPNNPSGNDTILGGRGNDELNGHDGADTLNGGPGYDICRGGPGPDERINCEA
jgi:Ca2+-binding RTX toxin-like protein